MEHAGTKQSRIHAMIHAMLRPWSSAWVPHGVHPYMHAMSAPPEDQNEPCYNGQEQLEGCSNDSKLLEGVPSSSVHHEVGLVAAGWPQDIIQYNARLSTQGKA